jgi:hypothetical protein
LYTFSIEELQEFIATFNFSRDIDTSFFSCVHVCSAYFSAMATQEILDELRPKICPISRRSIHVIQMLELLLPVHLPPDLHNQGFKFGWFLFAFLFFMYVPIQIMVIGIFGYLGKYLQQNTVGNGQFSY